MRWLTGAEERGLRIEAQQALKQIREDLTFLSDQLDTLEHEQDAEGIRRVRERYSLKRRWER